MKYIEKDIQQAKQAVANIKNSEHKAREIALELYEVLKGKDISLKEYEMIINCLNNMVYSNKVI